jgi:hypothetical protein
VTLQDLFVARAPEVRGYGTPLLEPLRPTGLRPGFLSKLKSNGIDMQPAAWMGTR